MRRFSAKKLVICACALVILTAASDSVKAQANWTAFWQKFKTAVVKNDKPTVLSLSRDNLSNADYKQLFGTRARQSCFAKAKPVKDEQGNYSVFCGAQGYLFQAVGGQFKFIEGFAND